MTKPTFTIAVASADQRGLDAPVGPHFGRCPAYTLIDVAAEQIRATRVVDSPFAHGHQPGEVPRFIAGTGATTLLAGGIGQRAITHFEDLGVRVSAGHTGSVRDAVEAWLGGSAPGAEPCREHGGHGEPGHHDCGRS